MVSTEVVLYHLQMEQSRNNGLQQRTEAFAKECIYICSKLRENATTRPIITQLVKASSSVGANLAEAKNASSKRDFRNKIYIAKKEAQEAHFWLEIIRSLLLEEDEKILTLKEECREFVLIFQASVNTINKQNSKQPNT